MPTICNLILFFLPRSDPPRAKPDHFTLLLKNPSVISHYLMGSIWSALCLPIQFRLLLEYSQARIWGCPENRFIYWCSIIPNILVTSAWFKMASYLLILQLTERGGWRAVKASFKGQTSKYSPWPPWLQGKMGNVVFILGTHKFKYFR